MMNEKERKMLAVVRAVRRKLEPSLSGQVPVSIRTLVEVDNVLAAAEAALTDMPARSASGALPMVH